MKERQAGVFVTLRNSGQLRGCIGTISQTKDSIAQEIIANAIASAVSDDRFSPVEVSDLPKLSYEVSILGLPRPLRKPDHHDPGANGLIVKARDGRAGLLLPGIAEVKTLKEQFQICCQKGGIDPHEDDYELFEFIVEKHV